MTILLPTLAVAFAAFCVWLMVRIVNRRERWAKWTAVGLVIALVAYPLSIGPAIWLMDHQVLPSWAIDALRCSYLPLDWLAGQSEWCSLLLFWYLRIWSESVIFDTRGERLEA